MQFHQDSRKEKRANKNVSPPISAREHIATHQMAHVAVAKRSGARGRHLGLVDDGGDSLRTVLLRPRRDGGALGVCRCGRAAE